MNLLRLACLLACCLVYSGCTSVRPAKSLGIEGLPHGGRALPPEVAAEIMERRSGADEDSPVAQRTTLWLLPLVSRKYRVEYDEERDRIAISDFSMVGIGGPMSYAAAQFSFSRYEYPPEGGEAAGTLRCRYYPWWSWVTTSGEAEPPVSEIAVDVKGIPLLLEWGRESGPNWYFEDFATDYSQRQSFFFWSALWYIGPVYFDRTLAYTDAQDRSATEDATYFFPLFLGRAPGALLWMSSGVVTKAGKDVTRVDGHGPLLGYAGYYRTRHLEGARAGDARTTWLGGLLWSYERKNTDGKVRHTVGPLWGLGGLSRW